MLTVSSSTTTIFDGANERIAAVNALGFRTTFSYDVAGRRRRTTDARGFITTTVYDPANRTIASIDALANRSTTVYDNAGRALALINALGNRWTAVYNTAGETVAQIDPFLNRTTTVFDLAGRAIASIDPLSHRATTVFDAARQVKARLNGLGYRTSFLYDVAGERYRMTDANGRITTSVFDAAGRTVATVNALGSRTTTVFDVASQTKALIDPNGGRNTFLYDNAGRQTALIDPLNRRTTAGYDTAGRQTLRIDARGNRTTYSFDAADQLLGRRYPDGTRATFVYDSVGNRTTMRDSTGRYTYSFDALNRKTMVALPSTQRLTYAFDAIAQRKFLIAPTGGRFTYTFDAAGRITFLLNPEGDRTSYSYDNASRRTVQRLANGTRASFSYDNADQMTRVANLGPTGTTISSYSYRYDPAGNRSSVLEADASRVTWLYDKTNQLTGENRIGTSPGRNTFVFDSRGNRTLNNEAGTRTTTTYDAANQIVYSLAAAGRTTYTFDSDGNQQVVRNPDGTRTTTTWNYENQPTRYNQPANATYPMVTMAYNADNQRVEKDSPGATTKFIWDEQNYLAESDATNMINVVYTNEPQEYGNLVSTRISGTSSYHAFDALGSTRQLTNSAATITDTLIYDAWGHFVNRVGSTDVLMLWVGRVGYYSDTETGLRWVRERAYQPVPARWTSTDRLESADGMSWFAYVKNTPVLLIDPSGALTQETAYYPIAGVFLPAIFVSDCGAFSWTTTWVLSDAEKKKGQGFIIQRVQFPTRSPTPCNRNQELMPPVPDVPNKMICQTSGYFEIWSVAENGQVFVDDIFGGNSNVLGGTDTFSSGGFGVLTQGTIVEKGTAFFVAKRFITPRNLTLLQNSFGVGANGVQEAGILYSACYSDALNSLINAIQRDGRTARSTTKTATRTWNCCCPNGQAGPNRLTVDIDGNSQTVNGKLNKCDK
jgi:RHS repeat-associated protein